MKEEKKNIMYYIACSMRRKPLLANQKECLILSALYSKGMLYKKGLTLFSGYKDLSPQLRELKNRGYIKQFGNTEIFSLTDKGRNRITEWFDNMNILGNENYLDSPYD